MLIFFVGALLGIILGGALCVRYLRREITGDIGPKLKQMQLQLNNIQTELDLAITAWHAGLISRSPSEPSRQLPLRGATGEERAGQP
jgi:hypothetical protein